MGQKTNPIGNRLGIIRGWDSNWYGGNDFGDKLAGDAKIRKYLKVRLSRASVAKIAIERTLKLVTVTIHTARPGIIIGKGGAEVETLKQEKKALLELQQGGEGEKSDLVSASQKALARAAQLVQDAAEMRKREAQAAIDRIDSQVRMHLS